MNTKVKISMYWLLIGTTMILHTVLSTMGLFFGKDIAMPDATGEIPGYMYATIILTMVLPFILSFIQLQTEAKWFKYLTFVWSIILILLNAFHFYSSAFIEKENIDQFVLLLFILVINVFLTKDLYLFIKNKNV